MTRRPMPIPILLSIPLLLHAAPGLPVPAAAPVQATAHGVVRAALRAVEGDSARVVASRWDSLLVVHPADRWASLGLATIARLEYRFDDAERRYAALISTSTKAANAVSTYARLGRAWALDIQGLTARADTAFVQARAEARVRDDRRAQGEALIGLAINRGSQLGISVGSALLDTAERLLPADAIDLRAALADRRALFATVLSKPGAARQALAAADQARQAGEPRLEARALRSLALGLELADHGDSAAVVLTEVERIQREVHDRATLAETLMRHGDVFHNQGDIGTFKAYALAARDEALASGNLYALASSNVGLAAVALLLNDDAAAADYLSQARTQYDRMADLSGVALIQTYEADLAADVGDLTRARTLAETARDFDHKIGDAAEVEEWRDLINIDIRSGDLPGARAALVGAEGLARSRHQRGWDASLDMDRGRLFMAEGDPASAVGALTRHLRGLDTAEHVVRYESRTLLAEAEARNGQLARAELELTAAADELDAWRATITDRALRPYVFQASAREVNDRDASTATVLAAMAAGGRAEAAFALAERRRARDLADRLVRLEALRADSVGDAPATASTSTTVAAVAEGDVMGRTIGNRGSADSIAAALPDARTALLEYVTGARGAPTTLFVVTRARDAGSLGLARASLAAYALPSADSLAQDIARYVALLESGQEAPSLARSLGQATLDPALHALDPGITHLVIVPDGPLHRLPFDALRSGDDTPLVERYVVSVAPSAAALRALWRRALTDRADVRPMRLLVLADPTFGGSASPASVAASGAGDERNAYRDAFDSTGRLPRLVETGREARIVARYASLADVRLGDQASADFLEHAPLAAYRVIHIATHALVDERTIAHTALVLAPGGGVSGFVTPSDLAALKLRADIVVLSACRTAGGVVIDGEGVQGLTGPLLAAGARSVVATQWRIRDRATVPLVQSFYDALARGLPVADALRRAKREAIAAGVPTADWAAFTVVGDPLAQVALRRPMVARLATAGWAIAACAAVVALAAAVRFVRIRNRGRPSQA